MASWHVPGYIPKTMGKVSKVLVLGQKGVGKTSILEQLIYGHLNNPIFHTVEDVYVAVIESDRGIREKVRFYDTAGLQPKSKEIPKHYLSLVDGVVVVYAINDFESFDTVDFIKKEIDRNKDKKELPIILLGNKKELESDRTVEQAIAQPWASREKVKIFEVSAFDRKSLAEPFIYLTSKMNPPPSKSTFPQLGRKPRPVNTSLDS